MPLSKCPRCDKLFVKSQSGVCPVCEPVEQEDFEKVRSALSDAPNQTAEQLAEETGVGLACILRLLDEGRIRTVTADHPVKCGRCGAPAISFSKRLCETCLRKLNIEIAEQQAKIALPQKKATILGRRDILHDEHKKKRKV